MVLVNSLAHLGASDTSFSLDLIVLYVVAPPYKYNLWLTWHTLEFQTNPSTQTHCAIPSI